jgi:dihydrofolate reductase
VTPHDPPSPPALHLTAVAAVARNRVIGREGTLPWHLPEDLRHFKRTTKGRVCLMGRKTFDSILTDLGSPLPARTSVVLTRSRAFAAQHAGDARVVVAHTLDDLLTAAAHAAGPDAADPDRGPCLIGGAELYRLLLPRCDRLVLTEVNADLPGDALFPDLDPADWIETARRHHPADAAHAFACTFRTLDRRPTAEPGTTTPKH